MATEQAKTLAAEFGPLLADRFRRELIEASEFEYRQTMSCEWRRGPAARAVYKDVWPRITLELFDRLRALPQNEITQLLLTGGGQGENP